MDFSGCSGEGGEGLLAFWASGGDSAGFGGRKVSGDGPGKAELDWV